MRNTLILLAILPVFSAFSQSRQIDSLQTALENARDEKDQIKTLLELSWEYRFRSADTARVFGDRALAMARKKGDIELEVEALHNIGVTLEAQGNYTDALPLELEALEIRKKIKDEGKIANTLNNIGIIYDERGDPEKALDYYFRARKIYEKLGDQGKIGMVISNIGIVLKGQKEYEKVIGYYHEALAIYKKLHNDFGVAACHANLGSVYFNLDSYDSALYYSLLAAKEFEQQNIRQFLPAAYVNAGMAYERLGNMAKAKEYLLRSEALNKEYNAKKELAFVWTYLAKVYDTEGNEGMAIQLLHQAVDIAEGIHAREELMNARKQLAEIHASKHDFREAYNEFQLYAMQKDSLFQDEKAKAIAELQTKYETEKKENDILLLTKENEIKDYRLQRNEILTLALGIGVLSLIVFGYLWRARLLQKQKTRSKEIEIQAVIASQEEERKRFAADLHDGMGQMISALRLNLSREKVEQSSLEQAVTILNEMNGEIRDIVFNLMPQVLMKNGLIDALDELVARLNRTGRIHITLQAFDVPQALPTHEKIALYRICQEWINNILKYGLATAINFQLVQHDRELIITIEDDGDGFDPDILGQSKGNGWRNINSRLGLIKGIIEIDSVPGRKGTTVIITAPVLHEVTV